MADMEEGADVFSVFPYQPGAKMLAVSYDGRGFVAPQDEMIAGTRKGKPLLNLDAGVKVAVLAPIEATMSPLWARTASCSSSGSIRCLKWRAARAFVCRSTRTAASPTRARLRWPTG